MPKSPHEAHHHLIRRDPDLVRRLLDKSPENQFFLPPYVSFQILDSDLTQGEPLERRADTIVRFNCEDGSYYIVIWESQTKEDPEKLHSWPYYVAFLRAKHKITDIYLLVACRDENTAIWAKQGSMTGITRHGKNPFVTQATFAHVLSPNLLAPITDVQEASEDIILAVFSAITNALSSQVSEILEALSDALATTETDKATFFAQYLNAALAGSDAQAIWRDLMALKDHPYANELRDVFEGPALEKGLEKGEIKGEAKALLNVLEARSIPVPDEAAEKITNCPDSDTMLTWLRRAALATKMEDVFGD